MFQHTTRRGATPRGEEGAGGVGVFAFIRSRWTRGLPSFYGRFFSEGGLAMSQERKSHLLGEIRHRLEELGVYESRDLEVFCRFLREPFPRRSQDDPELSQQLAPALSHFAELYPGAREEFRDKLAQYVRLYPSRSQALPARDEDLERLFLFGRFLLARLPSEPPREVFEVAEGSPRTPYQHIPREPPSVNPGRDDTGSERVSGRRSEDQEGELLRKIRQEPPQKVVSRFRELTAVRQAEALTLEEHEELLRLTEHLEELHGKRLQHLAELAALRGTSLRMITESLRIRPFLHA